MKNSFFLLALILVAPCFAADETDKFEQQQAIAMARSQFQSPDQWSIVEDGAWCAVFTFENGLALEKTIKGFNIPGLTLNCPKYRFGAGSVLNGLKASEDGILFTAMPPADYFKEVLKMGAIKEIEPASLAAFLANK